MNKHLKTASASSLNDISLVKSVYNNIKTQIRSLENLDVKSDLYVPLLITVLQSKIESNKYRRFNDLNS